MGPESGVRIGDIIQSIDGQPVNGLIQDWLPYYSASNDAALYRLIGIRVTRGPCGNTSLAVQRNDQLIKVVSERIPRDDISFANLLSNDRPGEAFQILDEEVAYLKLSNLRASDIAGYIDTAQNMKGLIVDVRGYPSDFVVFELGQRLIQNVTPFAMFTYRDLNNPGTFVWTDVGAVLQPIEPNFDGMVVVLVDELTQSQAEYTAMALRAGPSATVIGSTTAGTDGDIAYIPLPGGMRTSISGAGVFYPDGSPTQRIGIVPDVFVTPTVAGIRQGRDEVLERALEAILGSGHTAHE